MRRGTARGQWSHAYRSLPYENGYLPWITALKGFLRTGFRGWCSMEIFEERQMKEDKNIPTEYAEKGMEAWKKIIKDLGKEEAHEGIKLHVYIVSRIQWIR